MFLFLIPPEYAAHKQNGVNLRRTSLYFSIYNQNRQSMRTLHQSIAEHPSLRLVFVKDLAVFSKLKLINEGALLIFKTLTCMRKAENRLQA